MACLFIETSSLKFCVSRNLFYSILSFNRPQILVLCPLKETLEPEFRRLLSLASQLKHGEYLCGLVMFCSRFNKLLLLPI